MWTEFLMGKFAAFYFRRCSPCFCLSVLCLGAFLLTTGFCALVYGSSLKYQEVLKNTSTLFQKLKSEPDAVFQQLAEVGMNKGLWKDALVFSARALDANPWLIKAHSLFGAASGLRGDMAQARLKFQFLKENQYENEFLHLLEAIIYADERAPEKARKALNRVLGKNSGHPAIRYYSGWLFLEAGDIDGAEKEFKRVLNRQPGFAPALAGMGRVWLVRNEPRIAARFFERAIVNDRGNLLYYEQLLEVYRQNDDSENAEKVVQRMRFQKEDAREDLLQKVRKLVKEGDYQEAVREVDRYFSSHEESAEAFFLRAQAFANLGQFQKARQDLGPFLLERWGDPHAHHSAGMCFLAIEDVEMAAEQFKAAVSNSPEIGESFLVLTVIDQMRGNYDRALEGLTLALWGGVQSSLVHYLMAQTYLADGQWNEYGRMMSRAVGLIPGLSGDLVFAAPETNLWRSIARDRCLLVLYFKNSWFGKSLEAGNRLTGDVPDDLFAWYYRALCQEARDHPKEARESFLKLIQIQPNLTAGYLGLGRVALKTDAYEEAEAAFQKALELDSESHLGHVFFGDLHLKRGEIEAAVKSYRRSIELAPLAPEAYPRLSRLLAENDDTFQEAVILSKKAERLAPEDPFTLDAAGWIMVLEGNVDEGMEKILSAQEEGTEDPVMLYHWGYALYRKKDFQNARQVLQKALQLSRTFPGVDRAMEVLKELASEMDNS